MAKIFWIAEKSGDYMEISAFNNKRKAEEKAMELAPHFSFGDNEVPKEEGNDDGDSWLYSGMINAKECFVLYRGSGMPHADGEFVDDAEVSRWVEQEGYDTAGACFPVKLKGGMGEVYLGSEAEANGSELFVFEDGEVYESKQAMKYMPTFESFIGSQKVNENATLLDSFDEYGWSDEYDNKYYDITSALGGAMDELVWITDGLPDFIQEMGKLVKEYKMDGLDSPTDYDGEEVEDPHGDAELSLFKYKGLKIGHFTDEMAYSACLCHERDVKKWTKIIKDMGEEDYLY